MIHIIYLSIIFLLFWRIGALVKRVKWLEKTTEELLKQPTVDDRKNALKVFQDALKKEDKTRQ